MGIILIVHDRDEAGTEGQGSRDQREGADSSEIHDVESREAGRCGRMGGSEKASWLHLLFRW